MTKDEQKAAILALIQSGPKTKQQIRDSLRLSAQDVFFACMELRDVDGLIRRDPGNLHLWELAE